LYFVGFLKKKNQPLAVMMDKLGPCLPDGLLLFKNLRLGNCHMRGCLWHLGVVCSAIDQLWRDLRAFSCNPLGSQFENLLFKQNWLFD
jgi:hypothetical protein